MTLHDLVAVVSRRWKTAAAIFVAVLCAVIVITALRPTTYVATARVHLAVDENVQDASLYQRSQYLNDNIGTYAALVSSEVMGSKVVDTVDLDMSSRDVRALLMGRSEPDAHLVSITAGGNSPEQASVLANTAGEQLEDVINGVSVDPAGDSGASVQVTLVDRAFPPESPNSPRWSASLLVGIAVGVILSMGASLLHESMAITSTRPRRDSQTAAPDRG